MSAGGRIRVADDAKVRLSSSQLEAAVRIDMAIDKPDDSATGGPLMGCSHWPAPSGPEGAACTLGTVVLTFVSKRTKFVCACGALCKPIDGANVIAAYVAIRIRP